MSQELYLTILRSAFSYIILLVLTKIIGRKVISQMNFFNFIAGITMGTITADIAVGVGKYPAVPVTSLIVIFALTVAVEYANIKSFSFRRFMTSKPELLIENGNIMNKKMRKLRLTVDELMMQLREKNIFSVADVEFAVLEVDGTLSVLPKSQKQPITPADVNLQTQYMGLSKDLIIDGKIIKDNLKDVRLDEKWLADQLKKQDIESSSEVFYAGLDTSGRLYVSKRN